MPRRNQALNGTVWLAKWPLCHLVIVQQIEADKWLLLSDPTTFRPRRHLHARHVTRSSHQNPRTDRRAPGQVGSDTSAEHDAATAQCKCFHQSRIDSLHEIHEKSVNKFVNFTSYGLSQVNRLYGTAKYSPCPDYAQALCKPPTTPVRHFVSHAADPALNRHSVAVVSALC